MRATRTLSILISLIAFFTASSPSLPQDSPLHQEMGAEGAFLVAGHALYRATPCGAQRKFGPPCEVPERPAAGMPLVFTNTDTGEASEVTTSQSGEFKVLLKRGSYRVNLAGLGSNIAVLPETLIVNSIANDIKLIIDIRAM